MSTTGRDHVSATPPGDVAGALASADFVRLVARPDGDALAAAGLIARALSARETPFQASVARSVRDAARTTDADCTVGIGTTGDDADIALVDEPLAVAAFEVVEQLGETPDHALALAGATVAGERTSDGGTIAEAAGFERRPGVAVPVADYADGLAHTTLLRAPFSGERAAAEAVLDDLDLPAEIDEGAHRRVASLVALAVAGDEDASDRASEAIEGALRPYVGGPFETVGGYGDVLDAVAHERPGLGVALALGHDGLREDALDAWRSHASRAHAGLASATTDRYDGLFVVRGDAMPVDTVARLAAQFRAPEPVTLVAADGEAAVRATDGRDVAAPMAQTADIVGGSATGYGPRARAQFDEDTAEFVVQFREAL